MKNYTITVNGNVYNVTVEEGTFSGGSPTPKPVMPVQEKKKTVGTGGSTKVTAPMPGKILERKVSAGQTVKKGDVLLVLEAMKMENEIVSPCDGTVASIHVASGDAVEAGAVLATLN